jgi:hypothetical protein
MFILCLVIIFYVYQPQNPIPSACLEIYYSPSNFKIFKCKGLRCTRQFLRMLN